MWDLEGIFQNYGSRVPRKMNKCTILDLYNVSLFAKGLSCLSLYMALLSAPHMGLGSMVSTVSMRKLRFPEVDSPTALAHIVLGAWAWQAIHLTGINSPVEGSQVWWGVGGDVKYFLKLQYLGGWLFCIGWQPALAQVLCWLHFPGLIWLLPCVSQAWEWHHRCLKRGSSWAIGFQPDLAK